MTQIIAEDKYVGDNALLKDEPADTSKGWSPNRSGRKIFLGVILVVLGVATALFAWQLPPFDGGDVTTNNAYVRGRTIVVSPQVGGYLVEVPVIDF